MKFFESFRIAIRALNANKVRSALTMLGVIIGVSAVILLVAIGTGVQQDITGSIQGLGSNLLFVFPGNYDRAGGGGGAGGPGASVRKLFTRAHCAGRFRAAPACRPNRSPPSRRFRSARSWRQAVARSQGRWPASAPR